MSRLKQRKCVHILWILGLVFLSISCSEKAQSLEAIPLKINLNLKSLPFDNHGLGVYESSNFFPGVRTDEGFRLYLKEFQTHHIVRVNPSDWATMLSESCIPRSNSDYSHCVAQFKNGLESSRPWLAALIQYNKTKIFVVDIFRTPTWLSLHPDSTPACGGGNLGQSYRPKDYAVWQHLLRITADFFKEFEAMPNGPQIYYQFWNEPDLGCNWKEGTAEFLQMYSQTMPYLKKIHSSAKVGGAGLEAWAGIVEKDRPTRPQNLNFDLMQFTKEQNLPMDFVSFHYFSKEYQGEFIDGIAQYRAFQKKLGIAESQMPIILSEWLPQQETPNGFNPFQAADAANLFLAFHQVQLWGQGGVPWQDYGPSPADEWGMVTFAHAKKKPVFYVYQFFDEISRSSLGIHYWTDTIDLDVPNSKRQKKFKIGERKFIFSKEPKAHCYKFGAWNRLGTAEEAAISFLIGEGISVSDLQAAYGADPAVMLPALLAAIKSAQPFALKWEQAFVNAQTIYMAIDDIRAKKEYAYDISFLDFTKIIAATGQSYGRNGAATQDKNLAVNKNALGFFLQPEEVLFADICF